MRSRNALVLLALPLFVFTTSPLLGETPAIVPDEVQEDWVLVIGTPDVVGVGPQITTAMSPVSDDSTSFAAFDLNYIEYPNFTPGGMQVQVWSGTDVLSTSSQGSAQFQTPGETITWTQDMSIDQNGNVTYQVLNGQSTTWGTFGGGTCRLLVTFPTALASLKGYRPTTSVSHSGATWEANYVSQLSLVRVRYYAAGRLLSTDSTQRDIIARSKDD
jgi:hypothetical protein